MNKKIQYKTYVLGSDIPKFFQWCLVNELYKSTEDKSFKSHMKSCFEGRTQVNEMSAIVAFIDKEPIGMILCEHNDAFTNAQLMSVNKVVREYDWGMHHLGMVSIYIKEGYRKNGIATKLFQSLEKVRLASLQNIEYNPLSVPVFQAKELSEYIVKRKAIYSYVSICKPKDSNYPSFMGNITHGLIEIRYGEKYPMYPLRKRKIFNPEIFKNESIKYMTEFIEPIKEAEIKKIKVLRCIETQQDENEIPKVNYGKRIK